MNISDVIFEMCEEQVKKFADAIDEVSSKRSDVFAKALGEVFGDKVEKQAVEIAAKRTCIIAMATLLFRLVIESCGSNEEVAAAMKFLLNNSVGPVEDLEISRDEPKATEFDA